MIVQVARTTLIGLLALFYPIPTLKAESLSPVQSHVLGRTLQASTPEANSRYSYLHNFISYQIQKIIDKNQIQFDSRIRLTIVGENSFNAFATEGNFIFIYNGMLQANPNIGHILSIMSHELGHSYYHHVNKTIGYESQKTHPSLILLGALPLLLASPEAALILAKITTEKSLEYSQGFSQANEFEADKFSFEMMTGAGFSPEVPTKALVSLQTIDHEFSKSYIKGFDKYSTHPLTRERIEQMKRLSETFLAKEAGEFISIEDLQRDYLRLYALSYPRDSWPQGPYYHDMQEAFDHRGNKVYWQKLWQEHNCYSAFFVLLELYRRDLADQEHLYKMLESIDDPALRKVEDVEKLLVDKDRDLLSYRTFIRRYQHALFNESFDTSPSILLALASAYEQDNNEVYSRLALAKKCLLSADYNDGLRIFAHNPKLLQHSLGKTLHEQLVYLQEILNEFMNS